jgi:hypothetical protein
MSEKEDLNSKAQKAAADTYAPLPGSDIPADLKPIAEQFQAMQAALKQYADEVNKALTTDIKLDTSLVHGTPGATALLQRLLSGKKLDPADKVYASRLGWRLDGRFFEGVISFGARHMVYRLLLEGGRPRLVIGFQLRQGQHPSSTLSYFQPPADKSLVGLGQDNWLILYPFVQGGAVNWYYTVFDSCTLPADAPLCQRCDKCQNGPHRWVLFDFAQLHRNAVDLYLFNEKYPPPIDPAHHYQVGECRLKVPEHAPPETHWL